MQGYGQMNNEMGRYFRTLPRSIQQEILQCGVVFRTTADMKRCVQYLMEHP